MGQKLYTNNNVQYTGNSPIDAYNFYKKNEQAAQQMLDGINFTSTQDMSAKLGQNFIPSANANLVTNPATQITKNAKSSNSILGVNTSLLAGLALGAGVALVATNPKIQKTLVNTAVKVWSGLQANIEEIKEQVEDAKAEMAEKD